MNPSIVARQQIGKDFPAATNNCWRLLFSMRSVSYQRKTGDQFLSEIPAFNKQSFQCLQNEFGCVSDGMSRETTGPYIEQQGTKLPNRYNFRPMQNQKEEFK
jgi:hypothetical protein